jgi:hypothetical protein
MKKLHRTNFKAAQKLAREEPLILSCFSGDTRWHAQIG